MAKWRSLEVYTPFARRLVEYMWEQRPPLLPNQFAQAVGVRKQALSTWLNCDAVPAPPVVVRLAREMGRPVRQLMIDAGYAAPEDPLLDVADAWAYARGVVEQMDDAAWIELAAAASPAPPGSRDALLTLLQRLQDHSMLALRDHPLSATSPSAVGADAADTPTSSASAQRDEPVDEEDARS